MSINLDTCTVEELRDELATVGGGPWEKRNGRWYHRDWHKLGSGQKRHPVPWSLGFVADLMPDGWQIEVHQCTHLDGRTEAWLIHAYFNKGEREAHSEGKTELEARARCVAKVLTARRAEEKQT